MNLKAELIVSHYYLIKTIAKHLYGYFGGNIEYDDMVSDGGLGLIDAACKYDANKAKFITYATIKIRGAILDGVRKMDWSPRRSRYKGNIRQIVPLIDNLYFNEIDFTEVIEEKLIISNAVALLTKQERKIIYLYYYRDMTLIEVSKKIHISQARISTIKTQAICKLREEMTNANIK